MQRRTLAVTAVLALGAVAVAGGTAVSGTADHGYGDRGRPKTVYVIEHATSDVVSHTGGGGDAVGDVLSFHNDVFDRTNTTKVGTSNGFCIRTQFGAGLSTWECNFTTTLGRGSLTVEGPFFETPFAESTLAITGGTGVYRNARGEMLLTGVSPTEFGFTFKITR